MDDLNISWVIDEDYQLDFSISANNLNQTGTLWGSWKEWRSYNLDHAICSNSNIVDKVVQMRLQDQTILHIRLSDYERLSNPIKVIPFDTNTKLQIPGMDSIISMHLAAQESNIILLCGFNFSPIKERVQKDNADISALRHYYGLVRGLLLGYPDTSWILLDHAESVDPALSMPNLTHDTVLNVLETLK